MSEPEKYRARLDRMVAAVILAHPEEKSPACILADAEALLYTIDAAVAERFDAVDPITSADKLIVTLQEATAATKATCTHFGPNPVVNQQLTTENEPVSDPYKLTQAERALDALCEECRVYLSGPSGPYETPAEDGWMPQIAVALNAFPAGARARLAMMKVSAKYIEKLHEAARLVSECERLQQGEGA